jgi:alcohol dehydrogenase YqhD (iron-dependent ADH family)
MEYCLDDTTVDKYVQFAQNVFGIHGSDKMEVAHKGIEALKDLLFNQLSLKSTLPEVGIDQTHFDSMAEKAVKNGGTQYAFKPLAKEDVKRIYEMCMK